MSRISIIKIIIKGYTVVAVEYINPFLFFTGEDTSGALVAGAVELLSSVNDPKDT